jgi:hypothetical protein
MSIDFDIGFTIACVCLFVVFVTVIVHVGGCDNIVEETWLTSRSNENSVVENPINNV